MRYCFDTGAFITSWRTWHPIDVFPSLWDRLEDLIASGEIVSPDVVHDELKQKDDELARWAKRRKGLFLPLSAEVQDATSTILRDYPRLMEEGSDRNRADPFVIATAQVHRIPIVTGERKQGKEQKPTIPFVCNAIGVKHLGIIRFFREEKWTF